MASKPTDRMVVMGVYEDCTHAERGIARLDALRIARHDLSVIAHPHVAMQHENGAWKPRNVAAHALRPTSGGLAETITLSATLVGIALFALPLGALLVAGPIAMIGGGAMAFASPLLSPDTLGDLGVPRRDAKLAIEAIRRGAIVLVLTVEARQARVAAEALDRAGAIDLHARAALWESEGWTYEPNAPVWTHADIEREVVLRHPMRGIPRTNSPSYA